MTSGYELSLHVEFAQNPEPRCPCVLLLDISGSMRNDGRIDALNQGIRVFRDALIENPLAARRAEVAIVTFNDQITLVQDFVTVDSFIPPTLQAREKTFMGQGLLAALDQLEKRKQSYRTNGIAYFQPWLFMITDGEPHGGWNPRVQEAADQIAAAEDARKLIFRAVGVAEANMKILSRLSVRPPIKLRGLEFSELFSWLSASIESHSMSVPGALIETPDPSTIWTIDEDDDCWDESTGQVALEPSEEWSDHDEY